MCGVSFYISEQSHFEQELIQSLKEMEHRGPDAEGMFTTEICGYNIGLGHKRLSIIDLSESANQPMTKSGVSISYNGEIYNYKELRDRLIQEGVKFKSTSDTEVILSLFIKYGVESFSMLRGMFAFVLLDEINKKTYVVRDKVGVKPIYIYSRGNSMFGCSEIKGLKRFSVVDASISDQDLFEFFNTGFLYEPDTGYKHIKKLLPGHFLTIDLQTNKKEIQTLRDYTSYSANENLEKKLEKSLQTQQIADVPLGIFYSGGIDSTLLAVKAKNPKLYFAKYDDDPFSNEDLKYSSLISNFLKKDLNILSLQSEKKSAEHILESFHFVAKYTEELVSDYTFWSTYNLSKAARDNGLKVMLSGMGGDEIFVGYPRFLILKWHLYIQYLSKIFKFIERFRLFPKKYDKKIERLVSYSQEEDWPLAYSRLLGYFSKDELKGFFANFDLQNEEYLKKLKSIRETFPGDFDDKVKVAQYYDLTGFLSHNLVVSDKASMLASIELRVPLLDEAIVEEGLSTDSKILIKNFSLKKPLRLILKSILPRRFLSRPKTGFNPPLDNLIQTIGEKRIIEEVEILSKKIDIFQANKIIRQHFSGRKNNTYKVWQLLYVSFWIKMNSNV